MLCGGYQPKQKRPEDMPVVSVPTMSDAYINTIKEVKKNTIIIPPDATNGNMFIRAYGYEIKGRASGRVYLEGICFGFDEGWWDSPYI